MNHLAIACAAALTLMTAPSANASVKFSLVNIGNAGNAADPLTGFGSVSYEYRISTTEVTNAQYTDFLNAVAATDQFGGPDPHLYNTSMASAPTAGIVRAGSPGSYSYSVVTGRENKPVVLTSYFDSMRFVNWLENGQGSGGTETGVYNITNGTAETRAAGASYFIPSEDEWYKAAYHQPIAEGGDVDNYWLYPTSSNTAPIGGVEAQIVPRLIDDVLDVGSFDANFYGVFDMGGNVSEIHEALMLGGAFRGRRGGSLANEQSILRSIERFAMGPTTEFTTSGFRIARSIPTPASATLLAIGAISLSRRRR